MRAGFVAAFAVVEVASSVQGQDFGDFAFDDVAGTWHGSDGVFSVAYARHGYTVSGPSWSGTGSFSGSTFTVTRVLAPGVVGSLAGTSGRTETLTYSYSRGGNYDWLIRKGESL